MGDLLPPRRRLGIAPDAFVFLCFGKLRRDKSIPLLLDAFRACEAPNAVLVVAGLPEHADVATAVAVSANLDRRIKPILDFVPPEEVAALHAHQGRDRLREERCAGERKCVGHTPDGVRDHFVESLLREHARPLVVRGEQPT